jgi:hypothetical protein
MQHMPPSCLDHGIYMYMYMYMHLYVYVMYTYARTYVCMCMHTYMYTAHVRVFLNVNVNVHANATHVTHLHICVSFILDSVFLWLEEHTTDTHVYTMHIQWVSVYSHRHPRAHPRVYYEYYIPQTSTCILCTYSCVYARAYSFYFYCLLLTTFMA